MPRSRRPKPGPGQLPMFMSAREIQAQYQPLPGDFDEKHDEDTGATVPETTGQFWQRKTDESKLPPAEYQHRIKEGHDSREPYELPEMDWDKAMERTDYPVQRTREGTDDYMARVEPWEADRMGSHQSRIEAFIEGPSLYAQVRSQGVQAPVHLGVSHPPMIDAGTKTILGGHHRIAASAEIDPDRLMPVLHHDGNGPKNAGHTYIEMQKAGNGQHKMLTKRKFTGYDYT